MKKVFLAFAIILVIGLILAFTGFALLGFDSNAITKAFTNQRDADFTAVSKTVELLPQKLEIDCINNTIEFYEIEEDKITFDYYQSDYYFFELSESSELVKLKAIKENQTWLKRWSLELGTISPHIQKVRVGLSKNFAGQLIIETTNGDVDLSSTNELELLKINMTNGKVNIKNISVANDISIDNTNGIISLKDITVSKNCTVKTTNGNITVASTVANIIDASTTNGRIAITGAQAQELLSHTTNGNISISYTNCLKMDTQTTNGNIIINALGNFEDTKMIIRNTVGSITVNGVKYATQTLNPNASKSISAKSTNGNITIDFKELAN